MTTKTISKKTLFVIFSFLLGNNFINAVIPRLTTLAALKAAKTTNPNPATIPKPCMHEMTAWKEVLNEIKIYDKRTTLRKILDYITPWETSSESETRDTVNYLTHDLLLKQAIIGQKLQKTEKLLILTHKNIYSATGFKELLELVCESKRTDTPTSWNLFKLIFPFIPAQERHKINLPYLFRIAAKHEHISILKNILPYIKKQEDLNDALNCACAYNKTGSTIRFLLEKGADANNRNRDPLRQLQRRTVDEFMPSYTHPLDRRSDLNKAEKTRLDIIAMLEQSHQRQN